MGQSDDGIQSSNIDIVDVVKQRRIELERKKAAIRAKISLDDSSDDEARGRTGSVGRNNPLRKHNTPDAELDGSSRPFGRVSLIKQNLDRKPITKSIKGMLAALNKKPPKKKP